MIRNKAKSELTGIVYKTVFKSQLPSILRDEKNMLIAKQGTGFSDAERATMYAAGFGPSTQELWNLYAETRCRALHVHWAELGRKIQYRFRLLKAKLLPPKKQHALQCDVEFPIRSITDPTTGRTYYQDTITKAWFLSQFDAEVEQGNWLAEQDRLGFSQTANTKAARAAHAAKAYHVDNRANGAMIGGITIKHTSHNVFLISDKTILNPKFKGGKIIVEAGSPFRPLAFYKLPDGNILLEAVSCIHAGSPIEVFIGECRLNRQLKLARGE